MDALSLDSGIDSVRSAKYFVNLAGLAEGAEAVVGTQKVVQATNVFTKY